MGMDAEVKLKWITRLEIGKDEQGKQYLNRDNKLCCLGVLCEIAVEEGIVIKGEPNDDGVVGYLTQADKASGRSGETGLLPPAVREWAGLEDTNPTLLSFYRASDLNDDLGMSFKQIAVVVDDKL